MIQNIFLKIAASVADAAAVIPNGIKTHLANGLSTYFTKGKPVLVMVLNTLKSSQLSYFMQLRF